MLAGVGVGGLSVPDDPGVEALGGKVFLAGSFFAHGWHTALSKAALGVLLAGWPALGQAA